MENIVSFFKTLWESFYYSVIYDNRYEYIIEGLLNTLLISFVAVIIGVVIGVVIALIRSYHDKTGKLKVADFISRTYINLIRGTPVILQLMIIYYVIFESVDINIVLVGILAFGINSGAYVAEIIRAGINSVPSGQMEAGLSLGLTYGQTMKSIILPQALKNILPALCNEFITLIKETSVGAYIGIVELTKASDIIASRTYDYFFPLIIIAIIYLVLTLGLTKLVGILERKLNNARS